MKVTPVTTSKITSKDTSITAVLDQYLPVVNERSVVAITSKIVSICEGRVIPIVNGKLPASPKLQRGKQMINGEKAISEEKEALIAEEAEWYLPASENLYGVSITIKNNIIIASAGIDESNADGNYVLWPEDPQRSANEIRKYLKDKFSLRDLGIIITDSRLSPLRWGVTGVGIAHSGFQAVNDMIGKPDIFGRPLHATKVNILDGLAASAVYVMGESNEQTPIAVIEDAPHIRFQDHNPTQEELDMLRITMEEDIFSGILKKVEWKKGQKIF